MTLIEVLVAVVLLGIGGTATMSALAASIQGSSVFESRIAGLAVLETSASGLTKQVQPCTGAAYQAAARAAIPADSWGTSAFGSPDNMTASVVCDAAFHVVTLTYAAPNARGNSTLRLTLGGPTVSNSAASGGGTSPTPTIGDTTCDVASVSANPATMGRISDFTLDRDVSISVQLTGNCGLVRARLTLLDGTFFYPDPVSDGKVIIRGRISKWAAGPAVVRFEHELSGWTPMNGGATFPAFTVDECVTAVTVNPSTVQLDASGQLVTNVTLNATPSATMLATTSNACSGLTWHAATGAGTTVATGTMTLSGPTVNGVIAGTPTGTMWAAGTRTVEIRDSFGRTIGSTTLTVAQPVVQP